MKEEIYPHEKRECVAILTKGLLQNLTEVQGLVEEPLDLKYQTTLWYRDLIREGDTVKIATMYVTHQRWCDGCEARRTSEESGGKVCRCAHWEEKRIRVRLANPSEGITLTEQKRFRYASRFDVWKVLRGDCF